MIGNAHMIKVIERMASQVGLGGLEQRMLDYVAQHRRFMTKGEFLAMCRELRG